METEFRSYEQRMEEGLSPVRERLKKVLPDEKEQDDFLWDIYKALSAYEQVYMEIGMKAGAKLAFQLLHEEVQTTLKK